MGKGLIHWASGDLRVSLADREAGLNRGSGQLPTGELIQYWCAVAVGEELHFTRAAQRLHMDQSVVSRHIQKLEARLGFRLFIRTGRGIELSDAGRTFLPYARRALLSADQGERLAQAIARGDPQELKLAYSPVVDLHLIAQIRGLADGGRLHVPVRFESASSERLMQALHDGAIHAAVGILPADDGLEQMYILREKLYVAVPDSHRLAQSRTIQAAQLGDDPVIWMFGPQESLGSKHLIGLLQRAAFSPQVAREAQSSSEALGLVREGFGIAIVKKSELRLKPDGIVFRPFAEPDLAVETGLVHLPEPRWEVLNEFVSLVSRHLRCGE